MAPPAPSNLLSISSVEIARFLRKIMAEKEAAILALAHTNAPKLVGVLQEDVRKCMASILSLERIARATLRRRGVLRTRKGRGRPTAAQIAARAKKFAALTDPKRRDALPQKRGKAAPKASPRKTKPRRASKPRPSHKPASRIRKKSGRP